MKSLYWLILIFVLIIIELFTVNLTSLWFLLGATVGYGLSVMNLPPVVQYIAFVIFSGIGILIYKFFVSAKLNNNITHTNFDRLIGKEGTVTTTIDNTQYEGRILVDGEDWRAVSSDSSIINKGTIVVVQEIHSTRLYVKTKERKEDN